MLIKLVPVSTIGLVQIKERPGFGMLTGIPVYIDIDRFKELIWPALELRLEMDVLIDVRFLDNTQKAE